MTDTTETKATPASWSAPFALAVAVGLALGLIVAFLGSNDSRHLVTGGISVVSIVALAGFFWTKKEGFGQFTVTALVLLVAVSLTAILAAAGKIADDNTTSIMLAVIGFSSGLALRTKGS